MQIFAVLSLIPEARASSAFHQDAVALYQGTRPEPFQLPWLWDLSRAPALPQIRVCMFRCTPRAHCFGPQELYPVNAPHCQRLPRIWGALSGGMSPRKGQPPRETLFPRGGYRARGKPVAAPRCRGGPASRTTARQAAAGGRGGAARGERCPPGGQPAPASPQRRDRKSVV